MITLTLPDQGKVSIYDDAIQMPADLYKDFQKFLLQDSGIGSSLDDISLRLASFLKLVGGGKWQQARTEVENLYYSHWSIVEKVSFKHMAFGCLIHSIDGDIMTDHTEDNITAVIKILSARGLTQEMLDDHVKDSKKKSTPN